MADKIVARLQIFQKTKKTRVMLVLDGPPDPNISETQDQRNSFSVHFSPLDGSADDTIKVIISRETDLRQFIVVSSDREIQNHARSQGAKRMNCKDFNRLLKSAIKDHRKSTELEKHERVPSPLEIKHWVNIFKRKK